MKSEASYFKIGIFVVIVLILLIAGLIAFSTEFWIRDMIPMETYLDESVQGLSVGSAVLQRGVNIGRVKQITFVTHEYSDVVKPGTPEYDKFSSYVMVVMEIDQRNFPLYKEDPEEFRRRLRYLINNGLRVKLAYQGITGLAFLEMDFIGPEEKPMFPPWMPHNLYIPSTPSLITSFTSAVEDAFKRFENIDIEGAVNQLTNTLDRVETALNEAQIGILSKNATALMEDIRKTSDRFRMIIEEAADPNQPGNLPDAVAQVRQMTGRIERLIDTHEYDIEEIMTNLKAISQNLRDLTEEIKEDPARLLFSSPPAKSEVIQ